MYGKHVMRKINTFGTLVTFQVSHGVALFTFTMLFFLNTQSLCGLVGHNYIVIGLCPSTLTLTCSVNPISFYLSHLVLL